MLQKKKYAKTLLRSFVLGRGVFVQQDALLIVDVGKESAKRLNKKCGRSLRNDILGSDICCRCRIVI